MATLLASGRTISVDSFESDASGRVQAARLSLSVGRSGYLYVGYGTADGGADMAAWQGIAKVQLVAPMTTGLTCALPTAAAGADHLRFFLVEDELESPVPRYDYLHLNGEQYVETPWPSGLKGPETVEVGLSMDDVTASSCVFCSRATEFGEYTTFTLFYIGNAGWRFDYNGNGTPASPAKTGQKYSVVAHGTGLYVDDALVAEKVKFDIETGDRRRVRLFAAWPTGKSDPIYLLKGNFYSYRLWTNDTVMVANYVPTATNGVACLYNTVSGKYLGCANLGAEPIGLGPLKTSTNVICQTATESGRFGGGRTLSVVSLDRRANGRLETAHLGVSPGSAQWLYAGCGASDAGDDLAAWDSLVELGRVETTNVNLTVDVLASRLSAKVPKFVRFLLLDKDYYKGEGERLESVRVDGSQYVQTDFVANQDSAIELELKFSTVDVSQAVFCARGLSSMERMCTLFFIAGTGGCGWRYDFNKWQHHSHVWPKADTRYVVKAGTYSLSVNDTEIFPTAVPPNDFTTAGKMALFASHYAQTGYANNFRGELYSFRAWTVGADDATKALDLIPCRKEGAVWLYNKVTGAYLGGNAALGAGAVAPNAQVASAAPTVEARPDAGLRLIVR